MGFFQARHTMKLLRRIILCSVATVIFAAIFVWLCPADFVYRWYAPRLGSVSLSELSGSIWQGHAGNVRAFRRNLGALDWRLQAWPLLRGDKIAQFNLGGMQVTAHGLVTRTADGRLDIRDAAFELPASELEPAIGVPALHLIGRIEIHIEHLRLHEIWVEDARGSAIWRDAAVAGAAQARLSDLAASFTTPMQGSIAGELHDLGGPLAAHGMFKLALAGYDAELKLAARDDDPHVLEALQFVGQPQLDGTVLLKIQGHLLKLF